jgi:hypothetical protein
MSELRARGVSMRAKRVLAKEAARLAKLSWDVMRRLEE